MHACAETIPGHSIPASENLESQDRHGEVAAENCERTMIEKDLVTVFFENLTAHRGADNFVVYA